MKLACFLSGVLIVSGLALAQVPAAKYNPPRMANGKPNLQGIWEARSAAWGDVEAHSASEGIRAGESIIVDPADGKIPYLPAALAQRDENFKNRAKLDPLKKCWMPGVPRITYMPYPFQIFQTTDFMVILYEYVHASRTVHMSGDHLDGIDIWMGDSRGKWDGDTFVVEVTNNDPHTWLDASGNHHSRDMKVVERYTRTAPNVLMYEATITDPKTYSKPWTMRVPLYLHDEKNAQLYEYECNVYREEALSK